MVWVSNRSANDISVTITNKTGGSADLYQVTPEALLVESRAKNNWNRSGAETATVTFVKSGTKFETALNALDVLVVYGDTYIIIPSTKVSHFGCNDDLGLGSYTIIATCYRLRRRMVAQWGDVYTLVKVLVNV